jgi:hypothetical protein
VGICIRPGNRRAHCGAARGHPWSGLLVVGIMACRLGESDLAEWINAVTAGFILQWYSGASRDRSNLNMIKRQIARTCEPRPAPPPVAPLWSGAAGAGNAQYLRT